MSAYDWAVVIAVGLLLIAAADCCRDSDYRDAWQDTTATSDRDRQIAAEQTAFDRLIAAEFPTDNPIDIPTQRQHRTEDPQ
ncbi:hypothetical protein ACFWG0_26550 [Streptomyces yangpuensis]|uniref:hypothetical protein n=1 Tax=Streptomyces yangpuensis TaxID=1648182 RepID=UPI00365F8C3B